MSMNVKPLNIKSMNPSFKGIVKVNLVFVGDKQTADRKIVDSVVNMILDGIPLPEKYHDHQLKGNLKNFRDCHTSCVCRFSPIANSAFKFSKSWSLSVVEVTITEQKLVKNIPKNKSLLSAYFIPQNGFTPSGLQSVCFTKSAYAGSWICTASILLMLIHGIFKI